MITLSNTSFNITEFCTALTECIRNACFVLFWQRTMTTSLNVINRLVCIMGTSNVTCATRTALLYITRRTWGFKRLINVRGCDVNLFDWNYGACLGKKTNNFPICTLMCNNFRFWTNVGRAGNCGVWFCLDAWPLTATASIARNYRKHTGAVRIAEETAAGRERQPHVPVIAAQLRRP